MLETPLSDCFILVVGDSRRTHVVAAKDIAIYRLKQKIWGLHQSTRHRTHLRHGSKFVVYVSGREWGSQSFFASGEVESPPKRIPIELREAVDAPNGSGDKMPCFAFTCKNIRYFEKAVQVRSLTQHLAFIKKPDQWWRYFQAGVIRIPEEDFATICGASDPLSGGEVW